MRNRFRSLVTATCTIIIVFIGIAFFDLIITMVFPKIYSITAFILSFAIGGILAAALSFEYGMQISATRTRADRFSIILLQLVTGAASYFLLSRMQHGEYEIPFKSFGLALALGSLLYLGKKI